MTKNALGQEEGEDLQAELQQKHYSQLEINMIWASVLAFPVVVIGMCFMNTPYANWIMFVLTIPVFWFGRAFFVNAVKQTRHGKANMDTLVALSTGIAFLFSTFNTFFPEFLLRRGLEPYVYFEVAAVIIAFILLGRLLEERAKPHTSSAIKKLIGMQPKDIRIIVDGEKEIPIAVRKQVDKIAGIFVPIVIGLALLSFLAWIVFGGDNAGTHAVLALITVLMIACPCALGLATHTAIMVGVRKGAEHGILIKDAESLAIGHKINAIVLGKTGTITVGRPEVTDMIWMDNTKDINELKAILLAIEASSEHPLAEAVIRNLRKETVEDVAIDKFERITGRGMQAAFDGNVYYIGNKKLLQESGVPLGELREQAKKLQQEAKTVIWFANQKQVLALIAIADQVKETAAEAIANLQQQGIEIHMMTGDSPETAAVVAQKTGIEYFNVAMLPADKVNFVRNLQKKGKIVAMIGDGLLDAQALDQADLSISMGKGSDIAIDMAEMTLMSSDLNQIPKALKLSKVTVRTIKQNLFWAFIYNVIGIPIAAGVFYPSFGFLLDPMIVGVAMALSLVSVVTNSLRIKSLKLEY